MQKEVIVQKELTLESMPAVLPKESAAWNYLVNKCVNDIRDRPDDKGKRTVVMTLELTPVSEFNSNTGETELLGISNRFKFRDVQPARQTVLRSGSHTPGDNLTVGIKEYVEEPDLYSQQDDRKSRASGK